ncbi:MAG: RimK family alpha-L-glutamate ligase [Pseudomonadota bacterium]
MSKKVGKIAIVTDDPGWHGRQLTAALLERGFQSEYTSLSDCAMQIGAHDELKFPGFSELPDGVFVRGIAGGSLEQVIVRLDILHALMDINVPVFNTPRAIERTVDKPLTSLLLYRAGLPTPRTWICESYKHAIQVLNDHCQHDEQLVLKPLFGSQGQNLHLVSKKTGLIHDERFAGIYYLQEFIEPADADYCDFRVFVVDGVAIAAMARRSEHWITNRAQGAACERIQLDHDIEQLAVKACETLNIDYAGVDLLRDREGRYYIIEVNSIPAWYGLQGVVEFNIANRLIDAFLKRLSSSNTLKLCTNE